jgi:glycosyltransferase involved in cell wall biosynthesis
MSFNAEPPNLKYPEQEGLISIIVPIYNTGNGLRECLDSILSQTFANWEAILVDDGSTDNTGEIVDEYAKKNSRFIVIHKQNGGTLLARKTGLEKSKGEFIANIDHDDKYHPQFLEKMHAKITETNADFVWCNGGRSLADKDYVNVSENITVAMPQLGMSCYTWDKLIKREVYAKVYFPNVNLITGEDPVQILQVAYHSKSVVIVPEKLYFYRVGTGVSSKSLISNVASTIKVKKILEELFNGIALEEVKSAFYCQTSYFAVSNYLLLDKKTKKQFKDEMEPILPELIKAGRHLSLNVKVCFFLASKGIEFPFKLREFLRKFYFMVAQKRFH